MSLHERKMRSMKIGISPSWRTLLTGAVTAAAIAVLLLRPLQHANDAYPYNYHGSLTSWFALMSENMEQTGFGASRCLPPINPNPAGFSDQRFYVTHPVLDVVMRAAAIRVFGNSEWVIRLQGLVGCLGAALLLFLALKDRLSLESRIVCALVMGGMPISQRLTSLSMHHPMTLLFGMGALCLYLRTRGHLSLPRLISLGLLLFLGMQTDWPGYFMAAIIWSLELVRWKAADRRLLVGLPLLTVVALATVIIHVDAIGQQDFLQALRSSAESPLPPLALSDAISLLWNHQLGAFGIAGTAAMSLALLAALFVRSVRPLRPLLFALALNGTLNFVVFPMKAPREDFWGCYWLPLAGLSAGVIAELLIRGQRRNAIIVMVLGASLACWSALSVDWDEPAQKAGAAHKKEAAWFLEAVQAEDRGILITNFPNRELKILMAYTRVSMLFDNSSPSELKDLKQKVSPLFHELPKGRVLYVCDPARPDVLKGLLKLGTPYQNNPIVIDITRLVSSDG